MRRFSNIDIYLGIVAFLGFVLTIWILPSVHPSSSWHNLQSDEEIELRASSFLAENGHSIDNPEFLVKRRVSAQNLNSLQYEMGRKEAIQYLRNGGIEELPIYSWEVDVYQSIDGDRERTHQLRLTPQGRVIYFEYESEKAGLDLINEKALASIEEEFANEVFEAVPFADSDSLESEPQALRQAAVIANVKRRARSIAHYHLSRSNADQIAQIDSLNAPGKRGLGSADAYHSQFYENLGHRLLIEMDISTRTGVLESMEYDIVHEPAPDDSINISRAFFGIGPMGISKSELHYNIAQFHFGFAIALLILFGIIFVIMFIGRLGAGEIDTKIASRLAIVVGVISFFGSILAILHSSSLGEFSSNFRLLLSIGASAVQSVFIGILLFVVGGVTDSISRQVWPGKLKEMDLIWNGEFINQPVGRSILRGVCAAGVLLFISVGFAWLANSPIHLNMGERSLYDSRSILSFYATVSNTFWTSYLNICIIFMGVCAFFYRKKRTKRRYFVVAILLSILLSSAPFQITGPWFSLALFLAFGFVLAWFFWEYGVLATIVGQLVWFLSWMSGVQSLVLDESFPLTIIISTGLVLGIFSLAIIGLMKGKDERDIKAYKPAYIDALAKKQRMFRELEIARSVQSSFLPQSMPKIEGIQIAAICEAATEVGGDYFDLIELEDGKVAMVIGDVSGKGIQAAFYMTLVKGFVRSLCRSTSSPADLLRQVNALFHENSDRGTFISMIYGVLDVDRSKLTFARAGHNPLLLKRSPSQVAEVIQPEGLGLGLVNGVKFDSTIEEVEIDIRYGDVLVFYTDGFSEAMDIRNDLYSDERLVDLISASGHLSADEILEKILDDVRSFVGEAEQNDDMTMIVVKLNQEDDGRS